MLLLRQSYREKDISLTTSKRACIAVDVGGNNVRSAIIDSDGNIFYRLEEPTEKKRTFLGVAAQIRNFTEKSIQYAKENGFDARGIGISIAGYIQQEEKIISFAPNFSDFRNVSFERELKKYFDLPILVENDGNCHALGEWWKGKGQGLHHMIAIVLGTGVGGGIIANDLLIRGARGAGAELGHITVDPHGPKCGCESYGCLEMYISATAMEKKYQQTPLQIEQKARAGDVASQEIYKAAGYYLGIAIATFCSIFEPEVVVLAGKISKGCDLFFPSMHAEFQKRMKNHPSKNVSIVQAAHIDDAGLLGAASLILNS